MNLTLRRNLRPSRDAMLAYAESLVDGKPMPVKVAGAIASDQEAATELRAMRSSLEMVAAAPDLEPSEDLTRTILLEARRMRQPEDAGSLRYISAFRGLVQGAVFTALVSAAAVVVFGVALRTPAQAAPAAPAAVAAATAQPALSVETISRAAQEVEALSAALLTSGHAANSPERIQRLRAVDAVDADLAAALSALDRNPGFARATHVVYTSIQRQADSLRSYYADRNL